MEEAMNSVTLPKPSRDFEQLCVDIDTHGCAVIPGALDRQSLEAVRNRLIDQAHAESAQSIDYSNPGHLDNQWVNMLINKGEVFSSLALHPLVTQIMTRLLGEHYLLSCCDAQIKHPGSGPMPLHTDQWWMPPPMPAGGAHVRPASMVRGDGQAPEPIATEAFIAPLAVGNVMWMVSDFTVDNGATRLVPGSHRSGQQPDPSAPSEIPAVAATGQAGDALVFDGRLWHGAGANLTNATRYGITCAFCGPQFRPLENYTLGLRPEVHARCSPQLLRRLGFTAWSTYGHTGDPSLEESLPSHLTVGEL